jgi:hypothetical protein
LVNEKLMRVPWWCLDTSGERYGSRLIKVAKRTGEPEKTHLDRV